MQKIDLDHVSFLQPDILTVYKAYADKMMYAWYQLGVQQHTITEEEAFVREDGCLVIVVHGIGANGHVITSEFAVPAGVWCYNTELPSEVIRAQNFKQN